MTTDSSSPFRQAEVRYFSLRGQLPAGRITRAQFDEALAQLTLRDPQGRYWALGADSGRWNVFQSGAWVEAAPYPGAQPLTGVPAAPPGPTYSAPPPSPVYTAPPPMCTAAATSPVRAEPPPASAKSGGGCGRTLG